MESIDLLRKRSGATAFATILLLSSSLLFGGDTRTKTASFVQNLWHNAAGHVQPASHACPKRGVIVRPRCEPAEMNQELWYRPRLFGLRKEQRCSPPPFVPRGYGDLFARPFTSERMDYNRYVLDDIFSQYGPAYYCRPGSAYCPYCEHCKHCCLK